MIDYRVDKKATVARGAFLGAFVVVCADATIEEGVVLNPGVVVGRGVRIGEGATIGPNAVIYADVPAGAVIEACTVWRGKVASVLPDGKVSYSGRGRPRKEAR